MADEVQEIRFQLGASFVGSETVEIVFTDGTRQFFNLAKRYADSLRDNGISTEGMFAVEG